MARAAGEEPTRGVAPEARDLARRLLLAPAGAQRHPPALAAAAEHACARLRQRLVPLLGQLTVTPLFRRALLLAQGAFPALAALTVDEGADPYLAGARAFAAAHAEDPALVEAGFVALLAHFIALLETFIGAAVTRRVLGEP